jgi:hypothetical protein
MLSTRTKHSDLSEFSLAAFCEILSNIVVWDFELGGVLQDSIDEFLSLQEGHDVLMTVEATPSLLR